MGELKDKDLTPVNGGSIIKCTNPSGRTFYYSTNAKTYYKSLLDAKKEDKAAGGTGKIVDDVELVD